MANVETSATAITTGAALHACIKSRWEPGEKLYGVVHAARDKALAFDGAREFGWKLQWLFSEDAAQQMSVVAPYLVPIAFDANYPYRESAYLDLWARRLGCSAGILLMTDSGPRKLRDDLSWAFQAADDNGNDYFFRFYDPRVLRSFLNVCTLGEAKNLFGTVREILVDGESPGTILSCQVDSERVSMDSIDLTSRKPQEVQS